MAAYSFNVSLKLCCFQLGGPYIPLKTGRRDGRNSRADVVEQYLPDHNESISVVLERFAAMGIDTPGVVSLLGMCPGTCKRTPIQVAYLSIKVLFFFPFIFLQELTVLVEHTV